MTYKEKFISENPSSKEDEHLNYCVCTLYVNADDCGKAFFSDYKRCVKHWEKEIDIKL